MGIKVKARQTKLSVGPSKGEYRFIMQAEIYSTLKQEKSYPKPPSARESRREAFRPPGKPLVRLSRHGPPRDIPLPCPEWVPCASACKPRLSPKWKM